MFIQSTNNCNNAEAVVSDSVGQLSKLSKHSQRFVNLEAPAGGAGTARLLRVTDNSRQGALADGRKYRKTETFSAAGDAFSCCVCVCVITGKCGPARFEHFYSSVCGWFIVSVTQTLHVVTKVYRPRSKIPVAH